MTGAKPALGGEVTVELEVPFHDVDAMRIVWHGHYLKYFEIARVAYLRQKKLDVVDIMNLGFRQVVAETACRHSYPLYYGDRFRVHASVAEITHRLRFEFVLWNLTHQRRSAKGSTTLVTTDPDGRLLMETPDAIKSRLVAQ